MERETHRAHVLLAGPMAWRCYMLNRHEFRVQYNVV
jgi:hypothetical protein